MKRGVVGRCGWIEASETKVEKLASRNGSVGFAADGVADLPPDASTFADRVSRECHRAEFATLIKDGG